MSGATKLNALLLEQGAPQSHLDRLSTLIALAENDSRFLAMFLVGSYAKGLGDRVSDLDLVVFAATGQGEAVLQAIHNALDRASVLNQFSGQHAAGGSFWKYVFLDFSSAEIHVFEPESTFRLKRPWLAVWDPRDLQRLFVTAGEPIRHEDFSAYEFGDQGLLWELFDCIRWLSRGRNELAKHHIKKLAAEITKQETAR